MKMLPAALFATLCLGGVAVAGAIEPSAPIKVLVIVNAHGLDLSTRAGADMFLHRIDAALNKACDDRPRGLPLFVRRSNAFQACRIKALDAAVAEVNSRTVQRRYAEMRRNGELRLAHS
jgi:UrcA family protein